MLTQLLMKAHRGQLLKQHPENATGSIPPLSAVLGQEYPMRKGSILDDDSAAVGYPEVISLSS